MHHLADYGEENEMAYLLEQVLQLGQATLEQHLASLHCHQKKQARMRQASSERRSRP